MALQMQNIPVGLIQGIETKADPKQLIIGKLVTLENAVFTKTNQFTKRFGYSLLNKTIWKSGNIAAGNSLSVLGDSLSLLDGTNVYSYLETELDWKLKGYKRSVSLASTPITSNVNGTPVLPYSVISNNNVMLTAWVGNNDTPGNLTYTLLDLTTNKSIIANSSPVIPFQISTVKAVKNGNNFNVFIQERPNAGNIQAGTITSTFTTLTPTFNNVVNLSQVKAVSFDLCTDGTFTYLVYSRSADDDLVIVKVDSSFNIVASTVIPSTAVKCMAITYDTDNNYVWVSWQSATNTFTSIYTNNLVVVLNARVIAAATTPFVRISNVVRNSLGYIFVEEVIASPTWEHEVFVYVVDVPGNITNPYLGVLGVGLASRPYFEPNGDLNVVVIRDTELQPNYFVVRISPQDNGEDCNKFIIKLAPNVAGETVGENSAAGRLIASVANVLQTGANTFLFPYLKKDSITITADVETPSIGVYSATFTYNTKTINIPIANETHYTGGILSLFDSAQASEHGFHVFPENITLTAHTTGGFLGTGLYSYAIVYAWKDNFGQVHRSAPSVPEDVTSAGATTSVDVLIPTLTLTEKNYPSVNNYELTSSSVSEVVIEVYRTEANGTIYYKVKEIQNDPDNFTVTYLDTAADADIIGSTQLYTTGGEVENISAPATDLIVSFKNRIILVPSENPLDWWYSKQVVDQQPIEFSDLFVQTVDQRGGPITALGVLDDKLILFKEDTMFYVVGDGPAPSGANNDFSYPQIITTDQGCTEPNSVVTIPVGLMYKSHKGIFLLDRSLQTQYVGYPVEAFNSFTISSAKLISNTTQVRFTLSSGVALVYDYLVNQWSVFTNLSAVDTSIYNDGYIYLKSDGSVLEESTTLYTDNGAAISMKLVTGWLNFAQVQGFQRVWKMLILGEYKTPHNLTVQLAYDFDSTVTQTDVIPVTSIITPEQFRIHFARQKCESVQVTIFDTPTTPVGQGLSLSNIAFEVGAKKGLDKLPASRSFG